MKLLFIILMFCSCAVFAQDSLYAITVSNSSGKQVPLSYYKGKKIIISSVSTDNLKKKNSLNYWDSLQKMNSNVSVILLPASDMGTAVDTIAVNTIQKQNAPGIMIADISSVKKDKGMQQHPLLRWLTHSDKNHHFNNDVETDGQLFIISESGVLYAVLNNTVSQKTINEVLKSGDIKE